jgi:hypothetical protein
MSHWIPNSLTDHLSAIRVDMCFKLLLGQRTLEHDEWGKIVTQDENWFYYDYLQHQIWFPLNQNTPVRVNLTIATERRMLTVLCNHDRFRVLLTQSNAAFCLLCDSFSRA